MRKVSISFADPIAQEALPWIPEFPEASGPAFQWQPSLRSAQSSTDSEAAQSNPTALKDTNCKEEEACSSAQSSGPNDMQELFQCATLEDAQCQRKTEVFTLREAIHPCQEQGVGTTSSKISYNTAISSSWSGGTPPVSMLSSSAAMSASRQPISFYAASGAGSGEGQHAGGFSIASCTGNESNWLPGWTAPPPTYGCCGGSSVPSIGLTDVWSTAQPQLDTSPSPLPGLGNVPAGMFVFGQSGQHPRAACSSTLLPSVHASGRAVMINYSAAILTCIPAKAKWPQQRRKFEMSSKAHVHLKQMVLTATAVTDPVLAKQFAERLESVQSLDNSIFLLAMASMTCHHAGIYAPAQAQFDNLDAHPVFMAFKNCRAGFLEDVAKIKQARTNALSQSAPSSSQNNPYDEYLPVVPEESDQDACLGIKYSDLTPEDWESNSDFEA